jgi:hypothetical protein
MLDTMYHDYGRVAQAMHRRVKNVTVEKVVLQSKYGHVPNFRTREDECSENDARVASILVGIKAPNLMGTGQQFKVKTFRVKDREGQRFNVDVEADEKGKLIFKKRVDNPSGC